MIPAITRTPANPTIDTDWLPCQRFQNIVDERRLAIALKHGVFSAIVVIQFVVG